MAFRNANKRNRVKGFSQNWFTEFSSTRELTIRTTIILFSGVLVGYEVTSVIMSPPR